MKIKIRVPATTSNLGAGFDIFGLALTLYNEFEVKYPVSGKDCGIIVKGVGKDKLATDESNLVWKMMAKTFKVLNVGKYSLKNLQITINNSIPLGSGLGSSASAIVAGISLANYLCDNKLDKSQIAQIATDIEGHPDNAVPAVWGGLCVCYDDNGKTSFTKLPVSNIKLVIVNPAFEIKTVEARKSLPKKYDIKDIVFNLSRVALLTAAFSNKKYDLLKNAVEDKVHQPYRAKKIAFTQNIFDAALKAGSFGAFISGSGPSLAAFVSAKNANKVMNAMLNVWKKNKISAKGFVLDFDKDGVKKI